MNDGIFKSYLRELEHLKSVGIIDDVKVSISTNHMNVSYIVGSTGTNMKIMITPKKVEKKDEIRHIRPHPICHTEQEISTNGITIRFVKDDISNAVKVYAAVCNKDTFSKEVGRDLTLDESSRIDTFYPHNGSSYFDQWIRMTYPHYSKPNVEMWYNTFKQDIISKLRENRK